MWNKMNCEYCNKKNIEEHDVHCSNYGSDGPEPPFYCSETCWGKAPYKWRKIYKAEVVVSVLATLLILLFILIM